MTNDTSLKIVAGPEKSAEPRSNKQPPKQRERATQVMPCIRIALTKQLDILRGYAAASGPGANHVTIREVAKIAKVADSSVSLTTPFFIAVGLLMKLEQKGEAWKYVPSQEVINFAKAYEWNRDTATFKLAPAFSESWAGKALSKRLSFAPLTEAEAIAELAEQASAGPHYKAELRLILDFMESSGVIQRDNGVVRLARQNPQGITPAPEREAETPQKEKSSAIATSFLQPAQGVVNFHVDVKINMDEFANWPADRIASFFAGIAQVLAAKGALEKDASK
jgi:hypothetical protein